MTEIYKYVVVNDKDEYVSPEYDSLAEARNDAEQRGQCAVVEFTYTFEDSDLVWTSDGSDSWPPTSEYELREQLRQGKQR